MLDVHTSSISRELKRNKGQMDYWLKQNLLKNRESNRKLTCGG